jgi:type IV pilus assembly protein PilV
VRNEVTDEADQVHYDLITAAGADPGCIDAFCTVAEIAQTDAFEWINSIEELLPGGEGVICRDSDPSDPAPGGGGTSSADHGCDGDPATDIFAIKVFWDHDRDPDTPLAVYKMSLIP